MKCNTIQIVTFRLICVTYLTKTYTHIYNVMHKFVKGTKFLKHLQ